jgi:hypothetical protein
MRASELPFIPVNNNYGTRLKVMRDREFWKKRFREYQLPVSPLTKAHCVFERHSSMKPDHQHLPWSFKLIKEAMVEVGIIKNLESIHEPLHVWSPASPGRGFTRVIVQEVA